MSLIKNMVLIITVVLSNNDKIIYELSESVYSSRHILVDEFGNSIDEFQIIRENDPNVYTFNLDSMDIRKSIIYENFSNENKFEVHILPNSEETIIDGFIVVKVEKSVLKSSKIISYYLKTEEISQLKLKSEFISKIIDNNSDLLFLYPDFISSDAYQKSILQIDVKWENDFSKDVSDKINKIQIKY
ncbi:MAG: hypothetical protein AAGA77_01845 [Bacteroidota bacterium]